MSVTLLKSIEWLSTYIYSGPSQMPLRYLTSKFVERQLVPLYELVPQPAPVSKLRRIISGDLEIGAMVSIQAKTVTSFTLAKKQSELAQIADDVGLDGNLLVVESLNAVNCYFTPTWLKAIQKKLSKLELGGRYVNDLLAMDPNWQQECLAAPATYKCKVVGSFFN